MIFCSDFKDTQCSTKVFKKEAIKDVLDELNTKGFELSFRLSNALKMFFSLIKARFD